VGVYGVCHGSIPEKHQLKEIFSFNHKKERKKDKKSRIKISQNSNIIVTAW